MMKFFTRISLLAMMLNVVGGIQPVGAAGVVVTVTPSSSSTSPQAVTTYWTRTSPTTYVTGTTLTVSIYTTSVSTSTYSVSSTSAIDLDQDGSTDTTFTSTSTDSQVNITFTVATTTAASTTFAIPTTFTFGTSPANYSFAIFASSPLDFGAALFYANGGNQVSVTANVPATLAFVIRNSADTADTNACALGTLSSTLVSTCSYRLRVTATNAANGFTSTILADHDLGSGSATMTSIGDNVAFAAGTEAYGIQTLTGATQGGRATSTGLFTQPVVEASPAGFTFDTDSSPVPTSSAQTFISYSSGPFTAGAAPSTTATTLVTHAAAISAGTPAGNYAQTITYTVTASY